MVIFTMKLNLLFLIAICLAININSSIGIDQNLTTIKPFQSTLKTLKNINEKINILKNDKNKTNILINDRNKTMNKKTDECKKIKFDYLLLSLSWPVNLCSKRACILNSPEKWFIHGLWPNKFDNNHLSFCCSKHYFNSSELQSIMDELKEHWQSVLATKTDESFWKHEWEKHGTCSRLNERLDTIYEYFYETLRLYKEINLTELLKEKNIIPLDNVNKTYDYDNLYQQIYNKRPYKFQIKCNPYLNKDSGISIIDSINFCYDRWSLESVNCPTRSQSNCKKRIIYPTFKAEIV